MIRLSRNATGALSKATAALTPKLTKLAYTALIRSHLEYCSAVLGMASKTQLHKLDIIQKAAARLILGAPRLAHSEPLLAKLKLDSLENRRSRHLFNLVESILQESVHPALLGYFEQESPISAVSHFKPKTAIGRKAFQYRGELAYITNHRAVATQPHC